MKLYSLSLILIFYLINFFSVYASNDYTQKLHNDIEKIIIILKNDHPGYCNENDKEFKNIVNQIEIEYKNKVANHREEYIAVLREICLLFKDSHLNICDLENINNISQEKKSINYRLATYVIEEYKKKILSITLPHFDFNDYDICCFEMILDILQTNNIDTIVFDLRGNYGGNSEYGGRILKKLYGEQYYNNIMFQEYKNNPLCIDWRISNDNLQHLFDIKNRYKDNREIINWITPIILGFIEAEKNNFKYYREIVSSTIYEKNNNCEPKFNGKIIFITDKKCVSACLDFIDGIYLLSDNNNKVIHFGEETNKDSVYMELRSVILSDPQVLFNFPIKVYRNRKRANNESYKPNFLL